MAWKGWLVVLGLTALWDSISVYIGPSPKEREKEKRYDRREKNVQAWKGEWAGRRQGGLMIMFSCIFF